MAPRPRRAHFILLTATLLVLFLFLEVAFRLVNPHPYHSPAEISTTRHWKVTEYDSLLGWKGVPDCTEWFTTENGRTLIEHNQLGFRDLRHVDESPEAEAIVFLGDSYAWGYEVSFDQMFVNLLREPLASFNVYNLSHRGYGTDQSLLTFEQWNHPGPIRLVILVFYDNDITDNNGTVAYDKPKPKFEVAGDSLVLTNVPVPRLERLYPREMSEPPPPTIGSRVRDLALRSHFLHDLSWRVPASLRTAKARLKAASNSRAGASLTDGEESRDFTLTARLVRELRDRARARGGELAVVALPLAKAGRATYQPEMAALCDDLGIDYVDLAPALERSIPPRVYYRQGTHLTPYGHKLVADAIRSYLVSKGLAPGK